ncbi:DNA cytosine methyltransferase [Peteryoungia ipomoeae]|uniref:DNA cytosine methyltransferase n=1 Tax=Peteryoungia ipomoeae TaxID=1210932 RepID=UPI0014562951|nr:DNA (cytosine-5-)-methyltransferase [Peteryoungia ipomoeae]
MSNTSSLISLFSGIGGFELGFQSQGFKAEVCCEIDPNAQAVLRKRFSEATLMSDVADITKLPPVRVLTAGFPCQNLSLVGNNTGINGRDTKIVHDMFRVIATNPSPEWLILENVPFMLWQHKGEAIQFVTSTLSELGYKWAYRVVDARAFGLPQRRRRVLIVASKIHDPRSVVFGESHAEPEWLRDDGSVPVGFSWTEGRMGLGWAPNCVPTIKGGSRVGVPSPPAIWFRDSGLIGTPSLEDAERLQGFPSGWTKVEGLNRDSFRWKLIGNALPVVFGAWLARKIKDPSEPDVGSRERPWRERVWPNAAYDLGAGIMRVDISEFPEDKGSEGLASFLLDEVKPLSSKAALGFLNRARSGKLKFVDGFLDAVELHANRMKQDVGNNTLKRAA